MDRCPYCGGKNGTEQDLLIKTKQLTEWNGQSMQEGCIVVRESVPKCQDCKRTIRNSNGSKEKSQ